MVYQFSCACNLQGTGNINVILHLSSILPHQSFKRPISTLNLNRLPSLLGQGSISFCMSGWGITRAPPLFTTWSSPTTRLLGGPWQLLLGCSALGLDTFILARYRPQL